MNKFLVIALPVILAGCTTTGGIDKAKVDQCAVASARILTTCALSSPKIDKEALDKCAAESAKTFKTCLLSE